jgi:hypothetical protein
MAVWGADHSLVEHMHLETRGVETTRVPHQVTVLETPLPPRNPLPQQPAHFASTCRASHPPPPNDPHNRTYVRYQILGSPHAVDGVTAKVSEVATCQPANSPILIAGSPTTPCAGPQGRTFRPIGQEAEADPADLARNQMGGPVRVIGAETLETGTLAVDLPIHQT